MEFGHHLYQWSKPFTNVRHEWSVIGAKAAIQFHVSINERYGDTAGLEIHYFEAPAYMRDRAPSQMKCVLTGSRCWHDGTSLYATETLWPIIQPMLRSGDHETIFHVLESEYRNRLNVKEEEETCAS